MILLTIAVYSVIFTLVRRKILCELPGSVLLSLFGYMVMTIGQDGYNIYQIIENNWITQLLRTGG